METKAILVRLPNWVGDVVMATPLLRALYKSHPKSTISLLGKPFFFDLLKGLPYFNEYIPINAKKNLKQFFELRHSRFDKVFLCPNSFSSAFEGVLSGAREIIGYDRTMRSLLLTHAIPISPIHFQGKICTLAMHRYYMNLLTPSQWKSEDLKLELRINNEDDFKIQSFLQKNNIQEKKYVVLAPGANFGSSKLWIEERWIELASQIEKNFGYSIIFTGSPTENKLLSKLEYVANNKFTTTRSTSMTLGLLKSLIHKAACLISLDTGPRHIGAAFNIPTVVLMGPNHPGLSDTDHALTDVILEKVECSPCHKKVCPFEHHKCMTHISVSKVLNQCERLLKDLKC
ncbi:MAG: lipopolysaccharide heptosyltransferase II [Deltaproteobacteria bacterium]|nr:lipopolysaccharide heptosyltransferase II [Deltaproteobacteria bacterium]